MNTTILKRPGLNLLCNAWKLLDKEQRKAGALIAIAFFTSSCLEYIALSSAVPFIALIIEPEIANNNKYLILISGLLGNPEHINLMICLGFIVILLLIVGLITHLLVQYKSDKFGASISVHLSNRLMNRCLNAPYVWFLKQDIPILAQRLNTDPNAIGGSLYPALMELFYTSFLILIGLGLIITLSPWQSVIGIFFMIFVAFSVITYARPKIVVLSSIIRDKGFHANRMALYTLSSTKDALVIGRQKYFVKEYIKTYYENLFTRAKLILIQKAVPLTLLLVTQIGLILIAMGLLLTEMSAAEIASQLALLVLIFSRLLPGVSRTAGAINRVSTTLPYIEALKDLELELDSFKQITQPNIDLPDIKHEWKVYEIKNTSFKYPDTPTNALNNVSLIIERGKSYGLVGSSGAGKSTLIDMILGLHKPDSGEILIDDNKFNGFHIKSWYKRIGYVPQDPFIGNETLRWNIVFGLPEEKIDDDQVWKSLDLAGIGDVVRDLESGLDTLMGERGLRLSGGQVQRIAIARALYSKPDLLILDEATSALDTLTERAVQDAVNNLHGMITTITIAHRLTTIKKSDSIFVLKDGYLVGTGKYDDLIESNKLFQDLAEEEPSTKPIAV